MEKSEAIAMVKIKIKDLQVFVDTCENMNPDVIRERQIEMKNLREELHRLVNS